MSDIEGGKKPPDPPVKKPREKYLYNDNTNYSEFKVLVTKPRDFDIVEVSNIIKSNTKSGEVKETVTTGAKSVVIHCTNKKVANHLACAPEFSENGYTAYIPIYYITSCGMIQGIKKKYTEDEIKSQLDARQITIFKVERMTRRESVNGAMENIPTERMKIYFDGNEIPQFIYINSLRVKCEPFIRQVRQCQKCWEYTHSTFKCTKQPPRCKICGEGHATLTCNNMPCCVSCGGSHHADYINCPEKSRQENINSAIAFNNMSMNEAAALYPRVHLKKPAFSIVTSNRFALLDNPAINNEFPTVEEAHNNKRTGKSDLQPIPTHPRRDITRTRSSKRRASRDDSPPSEYNDEMDVDQVMEEDDINRAQKIKEMKEKRRRLFNERNSKSTEDVSDTNILANNTNKITQPTNNTYEQYSQPHHIQTTSNSTLEEQGAESLLSQYHKIQQSQDSNYTYKPNTEPRIVVTDTDLTDNSGGSPPGE
ncbi:hypothetical protein DMENIID0001_132320 [Sergentomyia squamirostris]